MAVALKKELLTDGKMQTDDGCNMFISKRNHISFYSDGGMKISQGISQEFSVFLAKMVSRHG